MIRFFIKANISQNDIDLPPLQSITLQLFSFCVSISQAYEGPERPGKTVSGHLPSSGPGRWMGSFWKVRFLSEKASSRSGRNATIVSIIYSPGEPPGSTFFHSLLLTLCTEEMGSIFSSWKKRELLLMPWWMAKGGYLQLKDNELLATLECGCVFHRSPAG